tara:strand:+ start:1482 stop:1793 length:312 start_codon:yes stop_codon:yes gene_type:complete
MIVFQKKRYNFFELIVPTAVNITTTGILCNWILGMLDDIVIAILTCVSIDMECSETGEPQFGTVKMRYWMKKVYRCHEKEIRKAQHSDSSYQEQVALVAEQTF